MRALSLLGLALIWALASHFAGPQLLPSPLSVTGVMAREIMSGNMPMQLGINLGRVAAAFTLAMQLGTGLSIAMGRSRGFDRVAAPGSLFCSNCLPW